MILRVLDTLFKRKGRAPDKNVLVKMEGYSEKETHLKEAYAPAGFRSRPTKGDSAVVLRVGTGVQVVVASQNYRVQIEPDKGETVIFSTDESGEEVKARVHLDNQGNVTVNEGTRTAAAFADLKAGFDQLVSDFNAHSHVSDGTPPSVPSTADVDDAEVEEVRLP